jgi:acetamidase/formamidase
MNLTRQLGRSIHCPRCNALHPHWNKSLEPALQVTPGQRFVLDSPDASNGLLTRSSTAADIARIDYNRLDPLCGPVYVEGAEPGDCLKVDILELELGSWGWTGLLPDFGLLADEFPPGHFQAFDLTGGHADILGEPFPLRPMLGVLGVAPAAAGDFASIAPTAAGGNIDVRYLTAGASLYLPVFNEGALFFAGDGHAVQGDGEVCITALETGVTGTFRLTVRKDMEIHWPFAETPTHLMSIGLDEDLDDAAKQAVREMVRHICARTNLTRNEAYMLCSLAGNLRVTQLVDGNKGIHMLLPKSLL